MKKFAILALLALPLPAFADGAIAKSPLYETALAQDKILFDAYNKCDMQTLDRIVDDNLEFYHDKGGLMRGKADFITAIKNNICNKVERQLIIKDFEAYPLENYGFIEKGNHTFCNKIETPICKDKTNGIGKFFMLWRKDSDGYKLTRVISYDHVNSNQRIFKKGKK